MTTEPVYAHATLAEREAAPHLPQFAVVPARLLRCGRDLSHGAVKMAAWLAGAQGKRAVPCGEHDERADWAINAEFRWTHAEAASALGVTPRCTKQWAAELRGAAILIGDEGRYTLDFGTSPHWFPLDLSQAAELPPAPLASVGRAGELHQQARPRVASRGYSRERRGEAPQGRYRRRCQTFRRSAS